MLFLLFYVQKDIKESHFKPYTLQGIISILGMYKKLKVLRVDIPSLLILDKIKFSLIFLFRFYFLPSLESFVWIIMRKCNKCFSRFNMFRLIKKIAYLKPASTSFELWNTSKNGSTSLAYILVMCSLFRWCHCVFYFWTFI